MAENGDNVKAGNGNSKRRRAAVILIVMLAAAAALGTVWWIRSKTHVTTDDAFIDGHVYSISARVTGTVKRVLVEDNQRVRKGELILELDPADYITQLNNASSALNISKNETSADDAAVGSARAGVNLAESKLAFAARDLARGKELFQRGIISKQDYDKMSTDADVARSQLKDAEDALKKAQADAGMLVKGGRNAKIDQKKAELEQARLNLEYTRVYAPADGYITRKSVEVGNNVQTGQPLMALVSLEDTWVTANYKESQLTYVLPGQRVEFEVDAYPGHAFVGKVDSIMAGTGSAFSLLPPENATGNFVKIVQRVPVKAGRRIEGRKPRRPGQAGPCGDVQGGPAAGGDARLQPDFPYALPGISDRDAPAVLS
jgi:membrane fusion protein (multidrug efflux system)